MGSMSTVILKHESYHDVGEAGLNSIEGQMDEQLNRILISENWASKKNANEQ